MEAGMSWSQWHLLPRGDGRAVRQEIDRTMPPSATKIEVLWTGIAGGRNRIIPYPAENFVHGGDRDAWFLEAQAFRWRT
jgi:hypothetical protein